MSSRNRCRTARPAAPFSSPRPPPVLVSERRSRGLARNSPPCTTLRTRSSAPAATQPVAGKVHVARSLGPVDLGQNFPQLLHMLRCRLALTRRKFRAPPAVDISLGDASGRQTNGVRERGATHAGERPDGRLCVLCSARAEPIGADLDGSDKRFDMHTRGQ